MLEKTQIFFREVKLEIKKVAFPSKDELIGSTWVVIIAVLVVTAFLGVVDLGLARIVGSLLR
jgi:preprotein translocase subunit SecE